MFTIKADALSAILDKVTPHRRGSVDADDADVILLDCTRGWLHAITSGPRTLAVARTPIQNTTQWVSPLAYSDACALRAWLEASDHVHIEHTLDGGRPLLHLTEGAAQTTVPVASYMPDLPWREILRTETRPHSPVPSAVRISSEDLARWKNAGDDVEVWPAAGEAAFIVTAGTDFIGMQMPSYEPPAGTALAGWAASLRTRRFLHEDLPYEVGASYADRQGKVWRIVAQPAPGQEPMAVSVDPACVALPLSVVLRVGGYLMPVSAL
jgi:hypothetical protein